MMHINLKRSSFLLVNQVLNSGKSFLLAFVLARYFDKGAFGVYAFIIICLSNYLGFLNSLVYEPLSILKEGVGASYNQVIAYLFHRQTQINAVLGTIFCGLAVLKVFPPVSLALILLFFVGSQLHEYVKRICLNQLDTRTALGLDIIQAVSQGVILLFCVFLKGLTLNTVFFSLAMGCIPTVAYSFIKHKEMFVYTNGLPGIYNARYFKYIKPNLLFSFVSFTSSQLNNFVIFLVLGSVSLANCEAVRLLMIPLHITILAMGNILVPYFSRIAQVMGKEALREKLRSMVIFFLVVFVIFALFILWSGPLMLELFYKGKYARQLPLLGIFATIYIFDGLNGIVTYYLKAVGMIQHGVKIRIVLTLLNAIVLIPLIFRFREAGGLLATMFTGIVLFGSYFRVLVKEKLI